jgi:hypothetical protein
MIVSPPAGRRDPEKRVDPFIEAELAAPSRPVERGAIAYLIWN